MGRAKSPALPSCTATANGNMLTRIEVTGSQRITYAQGWDYENRLTTVTNTATSPNVVSQFIYDWDPAPLRYGDFVDRA